MNTRNVSARLLKGLFLSFSLLAVHMVVADELKPFTTDGCSMFPDGTFDDNAQWIECCIRHDYAYWKGGTAAQRDLADQELEHCVNKLGQKSISRVMHLGVKLGGTPYSPMWYRWGYGWKYLRGYKALTENEKKQVKEKLMALHSLVGQLIEENQ